MVDLAFLTVGLGNAPATPRRAVLQLLQDLHDQVVQRLAGASMALARAEELTHGDLGRAGEQVAEALVSLRAVLAAAAATVEADDGSESTGPDARDGSGTGDVLRAVVREALTNARKHATPTEIAVLVDIRDADVALEVLNDGIKEIAGVHGVGVYLARIDAEMAGGLLDVDETADGRYRIRLRLPR